MMMKQVTYQLLFASFLVCVTSVLCAIDAVFIKPVSQLCSEKLSVYKPDNLVDAYNNQPLSGYDTKFDCMRTAQALFNEWCTVIKWDKETHEVAVQLPHFLLDKDGTLVPAIFWTLDTNLLLFDDEQKKSDTSAFPDRVDYKDATSLRRCNTIILTKPLPECSLDTYDNPSFSAGTRFVRVPENDNEFFFAVKIFDAEKHAIIEFYIPKDVAWPCDAFTNDKERRAEFLSLVRKWVLQHDIVPYVWGGSSYMGRIVDKGFEKKDGSFGDQKITYWARPNYNGQYGFDCSGLVARVAQICGINYWFKTTQTAFAHGKEVADFDALQNGDLLVWAGHIVVVSDKDKGLLIESVGYGAGYGKLQEIELKKRLNMDSYRDVFAKKKKQTELEVLYRSGLIAKKISHFKVISLIGD